MARRQIRVETVARETGMFSHCIAARGEHLYISGQIPLDADGNLVGKGDIEAQTRQVFVNLVNVLAAAGAGPEHLVKLSVFLTDERHVKPFAAVRREFLQPPYPASTMVIVKSLLLPDWLVEVDAVAVIGAGPGCGA